MVGRLGDPPARLPDHPPTWTLTPARAQVRVFHEHPDRLPLVPRSFGPLARFDPHVRDARQQPRIARDGRGVLYAADELATALAEAFPGQWPQVAICPHTRATWFSVGEPVELLDLTGDGSLYVGAAGTLAWGDEPRRRTQRWGRRFYEQYPALAGIRYRAAHQGGASVALWERVGELQERPGGQASLWGLWSRVRHALAGQGRVPVRRSTGSCAACAQAGLS